MMMKIMMFVIFSMMIGMSSCAQSNTSKIKEDKKPEMSTVMPKGEDEKAPEMSTVMPRHLPYYQIPEYPESYSAPNVLARTIDGLGYRYHWATKGLRDEDLVYKPSADGRSAEETLDHLYGLASMIENSIMSKPNVRPSPEVPTTWAQKRKDTLDKLKATSDQLKKMENLDELKITFQRGEKTSDLPFWHLLNGPVADALHHVGQIVAFRRAAGNPQNPGVNVFMGRTEVK